MFSACSSVEIRNQFAYRNGVKRVLDKYASKDRLMVRVDLKKLDYDGAAGAFIRTWTLTRGRRLKVTVTRKRRSHDAF